MTTKYSAPSCCLFSYISVQLVFQQGVLFCNLYCHLALHVSANAIFRSTTVSWQPLACEWFSFFVIPCGSYLSRALTLSHGHWCVDGFLFLLFHVAGTCLGHSHFRTAIGVWMVFCFCYSMWQVLV